jgi:hypothetical protein
VALSLIFQLFPLLIIEMTKGDPCCHPRRGVSLNAVNDAVLLENIGFKLTEIVYYA